MVYNEQLTIVSFLFFLAQRNVKSTKDKYFYDKATGQSLHEVEGIGFRTRASTEAVREGI
jgi:hypothetical protein